MGLYNAAVNWISIVLTQITPPKIFALWDCASSEFRGESLMQKPFWRNYYVANFTNASIFKDCLEAG